jgi:beta-lactamase regulating signal transducer with metallopeptidase domain
MRGNELLQELVGFGVLNFWITAALGLAWAMAWLFRRHAAMRHLIRLIALMALPAIPVLAYLSPPHYPVRVRLPDAVSAVARSFVAQRPVVRSTDRPPVMSDGTKPDPGMTRHRRKGTNWRLISIALVGVWAGGILVFALRPLVALFGLRRLYRNSEAGHLTAVDRSALEARIGLRRAWELRVDKAAAATTAMTWGFMRPVVLLPSDAPSWSEDRHRAVLLHELAHVQRADSLTQVLTYGVCALYWFHPGVWLTASAMRQDAEAAADDTVLRSGMKPSIYAYELMQMVRQLSGRHAGSGLVSVSFLRRSKIETRICAIVDKEFERGGVSWRNAQILLALSAMVVATMLIARPSVSVAVRLEKPQVMRAVDRPQRRGPHHSGRTSVAFILAEKLPFRAPALARLRARWAHFAAQKLL